jgi:glycosyltransferase involved in cell wall biosynthesis
MSEPLVSVIIPCYNVEKSIIKALTSLINQTYKNWEALLINDGSTDSTREKILEIQDSRIKYFEFSENRGRAAARQKGLDEAQGEYLSMLDADDWIYNNKLEEQLTYFEKYSDIVLVSGGVIITDGNYNLFGYRCDINNSNKVLSFDKLGPPNFANAVCMFKTAHAKKFRYNLRLKHSQDSDFNIKAMLGEKYVVADKIWYVYSEIKSVNYWKVFRSYYYSIVFFSTYFSKYPVAVIKNILIILTKIIYHLFIRSFQNIKKIVAERSNDIDEKYKLEFLEQSKLLQESLK